MLEYSRVMAKLLQSAAEQRQAVLKLRKEGKRNRRMDREGQEQRLPERDIRTIGIIEDDRLLNQALDMSLKNAGYATVCARTRAEALALMGNGEALLLIDIGLPDGDGIGLYQELKSKFCARLQAGDKTQLHHERMSPAIFLTARDEEKDMLAAFDMGADDYVVKPFSMKVLQKRIEAVLKRDARESRERAEQTVCAGELVLYPERKRVFVKGREISLTAKEYRLLEYLMVNQGQVLTKENILEHVWGIDGQFVVDNTVSVTINRLRRKISPGSEGACRIKNVFGIGYRIEVS